MQSALDPAGAESASVAHLFWVMAAAGTLIWIAVTGMLVYATWKRRRVHSERAAKRLILWGGALVPSLLLALLLGYGLWLMPHIRPWVEPDEAGGLRIDVMGEQFWWRVTYVPGDGRPAVAAANEIRLPVGQRVAFTLSSPDVIHSFWIPALGGKMDMIPGRINRLSLQATRAGTYRGACAEFCGASHALMAFPVIAMEPTDFDAWLAARAAPAAGAGGDGHAQFMANGCAACHSIKGTDAAGTIGPDLSHVGSRAALGAGILPVDAGTITRFIRDPDLIKPGAQMPAFHMLPEGDIAAIAAYLASLQ